jgi:hypothetical protein
MLTTYLLYILYQKRDPDVDLKQIETYRNKWRKSSYWNDHCIKCICYLLLIVYTNAHSGTQKVWEASLLCAYRDQRRTERESVLFYYVQIFSK